MEHLDRPLQKMRDNECWPCGHSIFGPCKGIDIFLISRQNEEKKQEMAKNPTDKSPKLIFVCVFGEGYLE